MPCKAQFMYIEFTTKEKAWLKEFDKVMRKAPDTLFMFVGEGVVVYAKDENNERYMSEYGGMDSNATGFSIQTKMECDGGGY